MALDDSILWFTILANFIDRFLTIDTYLENIKWNIQLRRFWRY